MPEPSDEQFVQRRLLLACVLSAVAITAYVFVVNLTAPPPPEGVATKKEAPLEQPAPAEGAPQTPSQPTSAPPAGEPSPPPAMQASSADETAAEPIETKKAQQEREIVVESDTYAVTFSNRGAVATSWVLKNHFSATGEQLDLVNQKQGAERPFALALPGGEPATALNEALFVVNEGPANRQAPTSVTFEYSDGERSARKTFRFEREGYLLEIESEFVENGSPQPHLLTWNGGFGDTAQPYDYQHSTTFYYDPSGQALIRNEADDAEDERLINTGSYTFVGIDDLFFCAVFLPKEDSSELRLETSAVQLETPDDSEEPFATLAVGSGQTNRLEVFVGPKSFQLLGSIQPELQQIVAFGDWLGVLAKPLYWMLIWTHENIVANYGWAIIVVTLFINLALFPLKWKSSGSMKKMQALQPQVKQINEKYKGLSMRDPKKAKQQEELMALYKKHGVNPMGGCLPMVLQLPFFIAFYRVLTVAIEMRQAEWLWVADLSQPEQIPIRVLPLTMVATQFWMQHITPSPSADPAQARLMKFMPLMFGFIFYGFSSGLVLYWLTSNLAGVVQQVLINRYPSEPIEIEQPRKRRKKKKSG